MASGDWPSGPDLGWYLSHYPEPAPMGWSCPSCRRCYAPHMVMCSYCPAGPVTSTGTSSDPHACVCGTDTMAQCPAHPFGHQPAVDFIAKGHLGTPCPKPRDGGLCGCDEDDLAAPRDCYRGRCDC